MRSVTFIFAGLVVLSSLVGCNPEPRPLQYGLDACEHCRMTLTDERHGGEIVTSTGKIYTFDSVECLVAYEQGGALEGVHVHGMYVTDFGRPGTLIPASEGRFLRSTQLLSPMGANITSFARDQDANGARDVFGGELLSWSQVREFVAGDWMVIPTPANGPDS